MVLSLFPDGLQAGFLSVFSDFLNRITNVNEREANSQNIALLQGVLNPTFNPASGGGDVIVVDDSALLPDTGPNGDEISGKPRPSSDQISLYVVHEGDSLSQIAKMFGVSVNTIIWGNNLRGSTIKPGQTLVILPVSGIRYTVKNGDTLAKIAKMYKGDLEEIVQYNNLSPDASLAVGSIIIVPDGEAPQTAITSSVARGTSYPNYDGYYIRPVKGLKSQGIHGYNAVDIAAPAGTPVVAAASGTVIISRDSGWNGGYGDYVVIAHDNGTQTLYSHLNRVAAKVGESFSQGEVIGYVGSTGRSTGPHLHFEVRGARNPF